MNSGNLPSARDFQRRADELQDKLMSLKHTDPHRLELEKRLRDLHNAHFGRALVPENQQ